MADTVAEQLISSGEFSKAVDRLAGLSHPGETDRVLLSWAKLEIGELAGALSDATRLLSSRLASDDRARCLAIIGNAKANSGQCDEGLLLLLRAVTTASTPHLQADLLARYVLCALNWIGVEPALAELPRLRRAALESGNKPALAEYHVLHARISALKGWWHRVEPEFEAAQGLLDAHPHLRAQWRLEHARASVATLFGDLIGALRHAEASLALAAISKSKSPRASALGNLANISALAGDFARARSLADESDALLEPQTVLRLAIIDTRITIGLNCGDDEFLKHAISDAARVRMTSRRDHYYQLWSMLHHVKWLIHCGDYSRAVEEAQSVFSSVAEIAGTELSQKMWLLYAEALQCSGREEAALEAFMSVVETDTPYTLEALAETSRVESLFWQTGHPSGVIERLRIAWRMLSAVGLRGPRSDVQRTATRLGVQVGDVHEPNTVALSPLDVLARVGAILRLGRYPRVVAYETFALLRDIGVSKGAALVEENGANPANLESFGCDVRPHDDLSRIVLPTDGPSAFVIDAVPNDARTFKLLSSTFVQIARASRAYGKVIHDVERPIPWPATSASEEYGMLVGSNSMHELLGTVRRVATSRIPVLITGETGTGKELLARAVHLASNRSGKPFIPYNCAGIPRDILESQLFGHRKGAFTGAHEPSPGVIRAAAGGTLFLDEIGEMSMELQPKLLRFLESGEIHPLGEPRPIHVDVRVVAATNADLEKLVSEGKFREDLFYRLNVMRLEIPPLRERREEVPPLVHYFIDKHCREEQKTGIRIADETMDYLILYNWPGNVRQLANELRRMVTLAESNAVLMPEHLSHHIAASRKTVPVSERRLAPTEFVVRLDQPMSAAIEHVERSLIQYALTQSCGRVEDAANRLGLSRKGLYLKRHRLHIDVPDERPAVNQ